MTIKINKHRLKIIFWNDDFQNDPSTGETLKNVVLQLIIKMLLKKHTQFCSVGIFEGFIEARICLDIIWWRRRGWGPFLRLSFFSVFPEASFLFWRFNFKLPFALWWRLCHFSNIRLFERIVWVFIITVLLSLRLWMLFFTD